MAETRQVLVALLITALMLAVVWLLIDRAKHAEDDRMDRIVEENFGG